MSYKGKPSEPNKMILKLKKTQLKFTKWEKKRSKLSKEANLEKSDVFSAKGIVLKITK